MYVQPYVCFNGRCEEALRFYEHAIGARVSFLFRFDEAPGPVVVPEGWCDKVMHANLQIGDSQIMASDGHGPALQPISGISLSLNTRDPQQARRCYDALLEDGGRVELELGKTFWSPCFGTLVDRFGVAWMINCEAGA
ncbi:VOC family protein [Pseudomonas aeruginosa]|uniref:PhnB-like domain-containing protein n=1 Tax=Pseudomonas aeruginosa TaxID=287 RepID=A0A3M5D604_PSEAI|nr:glyoxalase/bleomycin resistance/extradiol dioxygenase family protein [Pseudomonas aeruginosa]EKV3030837.1 glyoxalase/bleomycin resistance/extradiol dioxygenase family protein [Pseudomonas aeruginosa]EKW2906089.1 glyoxalase/bleomycin resistance/extradiol dioxygenase family protein [Pseudomonas aeruginosa]EMC2537539.1 glyoxalase/bleomycin resistance/extradiol dioxygenase family protein [Pseudomonas aeruginosa]EMD9534901.1 glyoxalase/bleomycin resistance/extradiol dioxygenase family protein [Ps